MLQVPIKAHVWCWVAVLLSAVEGIAECPDGYRMHEEICYKAFDENENFLQASETCVGEGGTLALPKNPSTDDFLISLQNDMDSNSPFRFGLVNQPQEGVWEWIDGTPIGNYSAWNQGVGNSQSQEDEEYCAEYSSTGWNVERCSEDRGFICQIILAGCTEEYVYHEPSEMCYKAYGHRENYSGAVVTCFIDGGSLAMPRDAVTNKFLIYLKNAVDNNGLFRFGLTDIQQAGTWMWADNAALGDFNAWSPGEANNDNGQDEACAEFFPGNNVDGKNMWNDGQCSEDREFICQAIPTGCPSGYRMYEEICYKAFDENQNFLEASEICVDEGGTLAMPKDPSTDAFLVVLKNYVDSNRLFWFGLVDQHQQGDWEWIDGTPVGSYSAWDRGIANYQRQDGGEEYCAEYSSTGSGWNVERCSEDRAFICQIMLSGCPEEYVYHEPSEMCYKAYDHRENYNGAVATCFIDGGTLATPRDAVTNKFLIYLKNAVDDSGWFRFGLTDLQQEGTWMWADNVTLGHFRAWGPGEPNNRGQGEDCAEYFPGSNGNRKNKWNDGPCSGDNRKFICQVKPTDDSTTAPSVETSSSPPPSTSSSPSSSPSPSLSPTSSSVGTEMPWPSSTDSVVLAEVNVSLTLTVPGPVNSVNRSSLKDSIRQSLVMKAGDFCEDLCQIGEIFLHIVNDTNPARKKRQAADDEVQIDVIIQLLVLANQGQGTTNATVAAESLLKEKAEALRHLTRNGDLSITIDGEEFPLVDNSNNCPSGEARNDDGKCHSEKEPKTPPWLIGVICAIVVVIIAIAAVTVLLYRRKHSPGANIPGKSGNEMTNLDTPKRRDHPATDGSVDNIIYNTEDEGVVDNVIYNTGDDGTVDNVIYEGQGSKTYDRENTPESQYETVK